VVLEPLGNSFYPYEIYQNADRILSSTKNTLFKGTNTDLNERLLCSYWMLTSKKSYSENSRIRNTSRTNKDHFLWETHDEIIRLYISFFGG
jgi:hypothetical protein